MSEKTENTLAAYLGPEFQLRLMWQLLVEPEFAEKALPNLSVDYFDDPNLKRLFIIVMEFFNEYDKVPNLQNQSIHHAINKFKPNDEIEEQTLFSVLKKIELWNQRVLNKEMIYDGDVVQKATNEFIKQQEYRKAGEYILESARNGQIRHKMFIGGLEDRLQKIAEIGSQEDEGTEITEGVAKALRKEFRETIPIGVTVLDNVTGGGLGKGEIGLILSPSGVGKTTLLTKIANTAYENEFNVLQIIFEDTEDQVKRKHYSIWTGYPLSEFDANNKDAEAKVLQHIEKSNNKGRLLIKRFSQEDTTMATIRSFIEGYQKKHGFKFDIVILDYLDCLEPHKKVRDQNEAELSIIKSFEAMAGDFNIPCWTAIQSNRSGFGADFVEAYQTGGSIKRLQKAHFFMSIAKTPEQQESGLANIRILKARFAKDGQSFEDCIFDNDQMKIVIKDKRYNQPIRGRKKYDDEDIEKLGEKVRNTKTTIGDVSMMVGEKYMGDDKLLSDFQKTYNIPIPDDPPQDEGISEGATEGVIEGANTENDAVSDAVNEGVNDAVKTETEEQDTGNNDDLIGWTGETFTVNEVELEEIKAVEVEDTEKTIIEGKLLEFDTEPNDNGRVFSSEGNIEIGVSSSSATTTGTNSSGFGYNHESLSAQTVGIKPTEIPKIEENEPVKKLSEEKVNEIESRFIDDEDEPEKEKHAMDFLRKAAKNQGVVQRE